MIDEQEIACLAQAAGGPPLRRQVELEIGAELFVTRFLRLDDRRGEIVLALQRPSGRLLLHRKAHYDAETYRLLSGGIGHGEPIAVAALREAAEETGLRIAIRRLVAVAETTLRCGQSRLPFVSYVLHVDEVAGELRADPSEVAGFREVWPAELPAIAAQLRAIPGERGDWGRWRAIAHDIVASYFADRHL
jgi:ADP-ribose pyrophosphatase YjhB (NUDIX family)